MNQDQRGVKYWVVVAASLVALVYANYFLRSTLETSGEYMYNFYRYFYPDAEKALFGPGTPWWKRLLPFSQMTGSWSPTILVVAHYASDWLGPARSWYVFNAAVIVTAFVLSWVVFQSRVFSFTLAICLGFGTHLYYTYPNSGLIGFPLLFCYYLSLLVCMLRVVTSETHRVAWQAAFAVSLLVTALAYETWLDFLVFVWLASPAVALLLWREQQRVWLKRLTVMTTVMTIVGLTYIYIKVTWGYGQQRGMESDVVFNYGLLWPSIEDVVSNGFLNLYMALTTFLPPALVSSTAFYELGGDQLVAMQNGYHAPFGYLVPMQSMFMWRYFAGVLATVFVMVFVRVAMAAWQSPTRFRVAGLIFMIMIATGGPTHTFIKARPLNSMATQTYHVLTAVLGVSLLISLLLMLAWQRWPRAIKGGLVVASAWAVIFYAALARPGMVSHQSANVGLGVQVYPNPMAKLKMLLGYSYLAPAGLKPYQLERIQLRAAPADTADNAVRLIAPGPVLTPLPLGAPPVPEWVIVNSGRIEPVSNGWAVHGDSSEMGYQLISPPIPVAPQQRLLVRPNGVNQAGRVCLGVQTADQSAWLMSPEAGRSELSLDTGTHTAVRFVFANCMTATVPEPTRFVIYGVTYGFLQPPGGAAK